ncbi:Flp family type IVb pilin [Variovorax soli]|uniref:Pilus assembly protein Flp/PilA n=1 Tax=Variovorax soli TaxID=376815 RepID=A0ABU1NL43_9BURK|nr:Flp family type IVb pilin [Variovorax soli]MDR6539062.1 pilus assembly protein Flp/PilA [Variovorax soli]
MPTDLLRDRKGALIIEYALILALVAIALVLALQPQLIRTGFSNFITRFAGCLTGTCV